MNDSAIDRYAVQVLPELISDLPFGYGNDTQFGNTPDLIRLIERIYGPVTSFYGTPSADHWDRIILSNAPIQGWLFFKVAYV